MSPAWLSCTSTTPSHTLSTDTVYNATSGYTPNTTASPPAVLPLLLVTLETDADEPVRENDTDDDAEEGADDVLGAAIGLVDADGADVCF